MQTRPSTAGATPCAHHTTTPTRQRLRAVPAAAAFSGLAFLCGFGPAAADTLTGNLQATMRISTGCVISGSSGGQSGVSFGTLDFGTQPATFSGTVSAAPTGGAGGAGTTQILCSPEITVISVTVGGGLHAGQGAGVGVGTRAMNSAAAYIPYEVYQDASHTTPYPLNTPVANVAIPTAGAAFNLPIYGQVNKTGSQSLPFGAYTDTLGVTLTF
ncbi:Csu type fimbrial protein [Acidovorax sp. NCPPB 3576]|uniref:Csu type fimbrial protein n=1 Tax=Acidovorax sp. NCPPB 3576 TaxID=2940488 RepID=UPI00234A5085|nr:spore coat protein U domain-containing protein [Acidovorax sp. NCPPB 3576]WCM88721.1 spore coat U domain-containing protein [Acidovorax sp. NCPPB 3576]